MFRKLVSSVSFSPALVGQLGFYARRLRKEEATRRLGLIFTALSLVVQSFIVFAPPEPANAASSSDYIYGGVSSKADYLSYFDRNVNNLKTILTSLGITRSEISNASENQYIRSTSTNPKYYLWGREHRYSYTQGERAYTVYVDGGSKTTKTYARPMSLFGNYTSKVMVGRSDKVGWFALVYSCGNLVTTELPPPPPPPPSPKPTAICLTSEVIQFSDNQRRFRVVSRTAYGATISGYKVTVKSPDGSIVSENSYSSTLGDYTSPPLTFSPGKYTLYATVNSSLGNRSSANCQSEFSIAAPGISIEKTVNGKREASVAVGEIFNYQVTVKNIGETTLTQLEVSDNSPAGISFVEAGIGTIADNYWSYVLDSLPPTESKVFSILAKATDSAEPGQTTIRNTACVETNSITGTDPDDCDTALVQVPEKTMLACDLTTNTLVTIKKSQYNTGGYSANQRDCVKFQVCDTVTDTVITVREPAYDSTTQSKTLSDCNDIQVCDYSTSDVILIKYHDFNDQEQSGDASDCVPNIARSKTALNLTRSNQDATAVKARADDRIRYKLTASNVGSVNAVAEFEESLSDVLEYATIIDTGGGTYDKDSKTLVWPSVNLGPGKSQSRLFTVQIASNIPAGARGVSDMDSYDCKLLNTYGNSTSVEVACPAAKIVEQTASELPHTGPTENILFGGLLLSLVAYFYARSRQMGKEIRLVRRDLNTGAI